MSRAGQSRAGQGLQPLSWLAAPALAALVATVLLAAPIRVFGFALPEPVFPMVLAFAWAVIRPSVLAPFLLIGCGLFLDFFWSGRLGLWPTAFLLAYALAFGGRPLIMGQGSRVLLVWYFGATALAFASAYLASMTGAKTPPNLTATLLQFGFTLALFPLARWLIERFEDADIRFR